MKIILCYFFSKLKLFYAIYSYMLQEKSKS